MFPGQREKCRTGRWAIHLERISANTHIGIVSWSEAHGQYMLFLEPSKALTTKQLAEITQFMQNETRVVCQEWSQRAQDRHRDGQRRRN